MSKKMRILISVLVAVLILTVSGAAIALAQEEEEEPAPPVEANALLTRVAEILGIPEEDLIGALQQARQEMMEEKWGAAFNQALDRAVEEGLLTPEEAGEIREWWEQKPEALERGLLRRACGFFAPNTENLTGVKWGMPSQIRQRLALKFQERLGITQDGADEIYQWRQNGPESLNQLSPRARIFKAQRGQHMIAVPRGWQGSMPYQIPD